MKEDNNVVFSVEGYTNDLLQVSEAHNMKRTSLIYFIPISKEIGEEVITVSIDSENEALTFPIFDKMINKKIKISVSVAEDENPFKDRLLNEYKNLNNKTKKLENVLNKNGFREKVGDYQYKQLKEQLIGMNIYRKSLFNRLVDLDLISKDDNENED